MLNDDGDDLEEEERVKRRREELIEKEREERLKHLSEWKVTCSQNGRDYFNHHCCFAFLVATGKLEVFNRKEQNDYGKLIKLSY